MCDDRYNRQSFLGANSQKKIEDCIVGLIGLGGGGSHISQQLAHIGFKQYILYDPDVFEESNLNRLIGATFKDIEDKTHKIQIAKRVILGIQPEAEIQAIQQRWQENPDPLKTCDIIFGCIDGYKGRMELEAFSRRFLIPYIDIGIDVHQVENEPPNLSGQVIASLPGGPCMKCVGFITEEKLQKEAEKYGAAGHNPQVVWANGVVASTAVGFAVNLLTGWTKSLTSMYLSYEGNLGYMTPHARLKFIDKVCSHYPANQVGEAIFKKI
jgi:hypothetical protein